MRKDKALVGIRGAGKFVAQLLVFLSCLFADTVLAQAAEDGDEAFKQNGFELFGGATFNHGETNASFGLSYERRLTERFGIGGLIEYTNGREWVYAVPFSWRITEP